MKRDIYDNYNLWDLMHEDAEERLKEDTDAYTEDDVWDEINFMDEICYEEAMAELEAFFDGGNWLVFGSAQRWNGTYSGGKVFSGTSFKSVLQTVGKDCDYFHLYDEDGHFHIECSHHDGTNHYEVRRLTDKGMKYYENWLNSDTTDRRTEPYIHQQLVKKYSTLPWYAKKVFDIPVPETGICA